MAVLGMPPCRSFLGTSPIFQKKKKQSARGKAQTDRAKRQGAKTGRQQHQAPEPPKRPATQRKRPRRAHTEGQPPRAQVTFTPSFEHLSGKNCGTAACRVRDGCFPKHDYSRRVWTPSDTVSSRSPSGMSLLVRVSLSLTLFAGDLEPHFCTTEAFDINRDVVPSESSKVTWLP